MNRFWKWALIFLGVFVLTCLISIPLFLMASSGWAPMMGQRAFGHPMMYGGYGFPGFRLIMFLVRCLIPLGLLTLLVAGIIALVTYLRKPKTQPAAAVAASTPQTENIVEEPVHEELSSEQQPEAGKTCTHCGSPLQENWINCPFCGEKI